MSKDVDLVFFRISHIILYIKDMRNTSTSFLIQVYFILVEVWISLP